MTTPRHPVPTTREGRDSEASRQATIHVLRTTGPWLAVLLLAVCTFGAVAHGRAGIAPLALPWLLAAAVVLLLVGGMGLGVALARAATPPPREAVALQELDFHRAHTLAGGDTIIPLRTGNGGEAVRTRRVRAGSPPPLKPSYDGRQRQAQPHQQA